MFGMRLGQMGLIDKGLKPLWLRLVLEAEAAAAAAGASLWYVPPESYAARVTNGPFVNANQSGGNPTVGSGLVGYLKDRGAANNATQLTTNQKPVLVTAPGAAASALGFASLSFGGSNDRLVASLSGPTDGYYIMLVLGAKVGSADRHVLVVQGAASSLRLLVANDAGANTINHVNFQIGGNQIASRPTGPCVAEMWVTSTQRGIQINRSTANIQTGTFAPEPAWSGGIEIGGSSYTGSYSPQPITALCVSPVYPSESQRNAFYQLGAYISGL